MAGGFTNQDRECLIKIKTIVQRIEPLVDKNTAFRIRTVGIAGFVSFIVSTLIAIFTKVFK